mmetsp:Transcript_75362/g.67649  ORF Transcript_75362/g.67649 Transcript_75362/m.67649 type:complete len:114 (+) Transcript_75362:79-420(+)|eukprot:CAMPEP_0201589616 /NCGR_PEP_ID=MMETSP0190_2-20130828/168767_1 /ASSEMBLY_ACC=CAM_ASM_000263 /TAXON_ID=37353 /ORGANISM="Rosalina sp." /LENGTH=113 /DNA_ID=CAMNT_0048044151 /DNA_START=64 /DNA_END=405 /DNA_ORIENTATION=+
MNRHHDDDGSNNLYVVPNKGGGRLRACLNCKLIKSQDDWLNGCENCQSSVDIYGDYDNWTTPSFTGMCALMNDQKSWVAKHQRIMRLVPGLYAIATKGRLSKEDNEHDDMDEE